MLRVNILKKRGMATKVVDLSNAFVRYFWGLGGSACGKALSFKLVGRCVSHGRITDVFPSD